VDQDMVFPVTLTAVSMEATSDCPLTQEAAVTIECACAGVVFAVAIMVVDCRPTERDRALRVRGPMWLDPDSGALVECSRMLAPRDLDRLKGIAMAAAWTWVCDVMGWATNGA
jgi:hypothetical protein